MNAADRAAALVSWWVATYTRRLPAQVAERRRAEVASDLWEQRADASGGSPSTVGLSILRRMAAGIPADLRWRQQQLRAAPGRSATAAGPRLRQLVMHNWWLVLAALLGMLEVVVGVAMALDGEVGAALPGDPSTVVRRGIIICAGGLLAVWGIARRRRSRVADDLLVAVGALPMVSWLWVMGATVIASLEALTVIVAATANAAESGHLRQRGTPLEAHDRMRLGNLVVFLALLIAYNLMGASVRGTGIGLALIVLLSYAGLRRWRSSS